MMPMVSNPDVSVTLPRSEWLFLETFLVVHEMRPGACPHMKLKQVRRRLEKIKARVIKAERAALEVVEGGMMAQRSNLTEPSAPESAIERAIRAVWEHGDDEVKRLASPEDLATIKRFENEYGCGLGDLAVHCKIAEYVYDSSILETLSRTRKVQAA